MTRPIVGRPEGESVVAPKTEPAPPSRLLIVLAFLAIYIVWGSTYIAIKYSLETLPPFLTAAARFLVAGGLLLAFALARGASWPTGRQWAGAAAVGVLLLLGGNGGVMWAGKRVPSGLASVIIAMVPIFMAVLEVATGAGRPSKGMVAGVLVGFTGVILLVAPSFGAPRADSQAPIPVASAIDAPVPPGALAPVALDPATPVALDPAGAVALLLAAFLWAAGSLLSRKAPLPASPVAATGCEMLCGGAALGVVGLLAGEAGAIDPAAVSRRSLLSVAYLVVFGSIVAFSAYVWLLRVVAPTRVATYAYVNPVVALLLGAFVAGERVDRATLVAVAVIVVGVVISVTARQAPPKPAAD